MNLINLNQPWELKLIKIRKSTQLIKSTTKTQSRQTPLKKAFLLQFHYGLNNDNYSLLSNTALFIVFFLSYEFFLSNKALFIVIWIFNYISISLQSIMHPFWRESEFLHLPLLTQFLPCENLVINDFINFLLFSVTFWTRGRLSANLCPLV